MKTLRLNQIFAPIIVATALFGSLAHGYAAAPAPTDSYTNTFDSSTQPSWIYWYGLGYGNTPITWDGTMDAQSNVNSGSLLIQLPFGAGGDQAVWFGTFANHGIYDGSIVYDGTFFTNIEFDIFVDPSSPTNGAGNFGPMYASLVRSGTPSGGGPFNANDLLTIPITASNQWAHLTIPVLTGTDAAGFDDPGVIGFVFRKDNFGGFPHAPVKFWLDNVSVKFSGKVLPPPHPTMSIRKQVNGLYIHSGAGDYERQEVRTVQTTLSGVNYSWYGSNAPVTYSFTVADYPGANHPGFHTYIYMVPTPLVGSGDNNSAPDYQEPNIIWLSLDLGGDGSASYTFRWKTNLFASNGTGTGTNDFFSAPHEFIRNPTALGTWSATFVNNTNVTLMAPSGASTNFNMDPNLAALFTNIYIYVGVHADTAAADKGLATVLSRVHIQGLGTADIDDNFTADPPGLPDTSIWELEPTTSANLFIPDPAGNWIVSWSLPFSTGYTLQTNSVLGNTNSFPWATNGLPGPVNLGLLKRTFLTTNDVPTVGTRFFRAANPGF